MNFTENFGGGPSQATAVFDHLTVLAAVREAAVAIGIVLGLLYLIPILANVVTNAHWQRHLQQILR